MRKYLIAATLFHAVLVQTCIAQAGSIPYPDPGQQNGATYTFTATGGDVTLIFAGNGGAGADNVLSVYAGPDLLRSGLDNQSSIVGSTTLDLGNIAKGTVLTFTDAVLWGANSWNWSSLASANFDVANHVYSAVYDGSIPEIQQSGTYIAFEDVPKGNADFNYRDLQFVATNVDAVAAPGPLAGAGLPALFALFSLPWLRRRSRSAVRQSGIPAA